MNNQPSDKDPAAPELEQGQTIDPNALTDKAPISGLVSRLGFVAFMLVLTGLFVALGFWQLQRLEQKLVAIDAIDERLGNVPVPLPPLAEWVGFDAPVFNYRPVRVRGQFDHASTVRVFTSLTPAKGQHSGPGYWILAPFALEGGGSVFVNRGFVPDRLAAEFELGGAGPEGVVEITGIARVSEKANAFTPGPNYAERIEWVRNLERLKDFVSLPSGEIDGEQVALPPFAPIYIDQAASEAGALPQGGETRLTITNRHLEYAWTWFSFAIMTPLLLFYWLWRETKN